MITVFDYECGACGAVQELWLRSDEVPRCRDPSCDSTDLKKLPAATRTNWEKGPYDTFL